MILVVDDDPEVLEQAPRILNCDRHVFLASTASNSQAALPSFRNSTTAILIF